MIIATAGVLTAVFLLGSMNIQGGYVAMLPHVMRPTAWLAFALFMMAFTASSLRQLYPTGPLGTYSRWAMRNRRYIGLSFALVHFTHAAMVLSNLALTEAHRPLSVLSVGILAYIFVGLMALTSNNASVRWLGAKNWKRLHKVGSYYIWLIFMATTVPAIAVTWPLGAIIPVVGLVGLMFRISAARRAKR